MARVIYTDGFVGTDPGYWVETVEVYVEPGDLSEMDHIFPEENTTSTFYGNMKVEEYKKFVADNSLNPRPVSYPSHVLEGVEFSKIAAITVKTRNW